MLQTLQQYIKTNSSSNLNGMDKDAQGWKQLYDYPNLHTILSE